MANVETASAPRVRNKRAEIEDILPHVTPQAEAEWKKLVSTIGGACGTQFKFTTGRTFQTHLWDYPLHIVLKLAQSRDHNKHMDAYSDPSTDAEHEVRGVNGELKNGVWSQRGEAGPKKPTLLIEALVAIYHDMAVAQKNPKLERTPEKVAAFLEQKGESFVAGMKQKTGKDGKPNPVYVKMQEIKARRAAEAARALKAAAKGIELGALDIPE